MDKVIVVSADSHATPPPAVWPEYVEKRYHDLLPTLHEDNDRISELMGAFLHYPPEVLAIFDKDEVYQSGGFHGVWDAEIRLAQMDREGVAAELVYPADLRAIALFHTIVNRPYAAEVCQAGVRGYHRWLVDTFGGSPDRILLVAEAGPCTDMDDTLAEVRWAADHSFRGIQAPGSTMYPGTRPLYDEYWEPLWSLCEERGLAVVIHAGWGMPQGALLNELNDIQQRMIAAGRTDFVNEVINNTPDFFSLDLKPRRAMWQMMLGGVFDRHPNLKLLMSEVRGDWLPPTLRCLDATFERARHDLPAQRKPSEYFKTNGLVSLSFVHKAEIQMRDEIGLQTIAFGRDYPHGEGTWPNTTDWLKDAFAGVPEDEMRLMLGENAIRFLGLDRAKLADVAERIGPTVADITEHPDEVDPILLQLFNARSGYLKPPEDVSVDAINDLVVDDLSDLASGGVHA